MKKILSLIFAAIAVFLSLLLLVFNPIFVADMVNDTVKKSHQIESVLLEGVSYVEEFREKNMRLPTNEEYKAWASTQETIGSYSIGDTFIITHQGDINYKLNDPVIQKKGLGAAPTNSYLIGMWRGEWSEYYVSWTQSSTLFLNSADYYIVGSPIKDFLLLLVLFIISASISVLFWKSERAH